MDNPTQIYQAIKRMCDMCPTMEWKEGTFEGGCFVNINDGNVAIEVKDHYIELSIDIPQALLSPYAQHMLLKVNETIRMLNGEFNFSKIVGSLNTRGFLFHVDRLDREFNMGKLMTHASQLVEDNKKAIKAFSHFM